MCLVCGRYVADVCSVYGWYVVGMWSVCGWYVVGQPYQLVHYSPLKISKEKHIHMVKP